MSEKIQTNVLPFPKKDMNCVVCGKLATSRCIPCSAPWCGRNSCARTHVKNVHSPTLTAMVCVTCGGNPDGECAHCPAPLCQNWECREEHEAKHSDPRSDEEKDKNPLKKP